MALRVLPFALLLAVACASSRGGQEVIERIDDRIVRQQFAEALREAEELRRSRPGDAEAEQAYRRASVAFLLDKARRATFAGQLDQALEFVEHAEAIGPDFPAVASWSEKTRRTLAQTWYERGLDRHAQADLDGAALAYQRALYYQPGSQRISRALAQVSAHREHRSELGEDYYHEGVRALSTYWLEQARSRFSYANLYLEDASSARRVQQVESLLAEQRLDVARELEDRGLFAAAANEYRLALLLDPGLEGIQEERERLLRESAASRLMKDVEMHMLRGDHARALAGLEEAGQLSDLQREPVESMRVRIAEAQLESLYRAARDRERDLRYHEAIAAYERLFEEVDFYKDARTRRDTLNAYVRDAERLWERAMETRDPQQQRAYLLQIEVFWPEYRDLPQRLEALGRSEAP